MDAVSRASSVDSVNQILEMATQATIHQAEKMMKVAVKMAVGIEAGKGDNIDVTA